MLMVFRCNVSDNKSPQVSMNLLSIPADLNNAVVSKALIRLPNSTYSSSFSKPLVTIPSVPIIIGINVTPIFYSFLSSLARSKYLSLFSLSLIFILWSTGTKKSTRR